MNSKALLFSLAMLVALGAAFTIYKFLPESGGARHIDTRWFAAAATCLWEGQLPYDIRQFETCWTNRFDDPYLSPFVFGPPVLGLIWPLGAVNTSTAFLLVDLMNAAAVLALAAILWMVAQPHSAAGLARSLRAFWVFLGVTTGGLAGAGFVGQPVILSALGLGLIYLALRDGSGLKFGVGTLLCLIKPHITLLALTYVWVMGRGLARAKLFSALLLAAIAAVLFAWDQGFVADFLEALETHSASNAAKISDPTLLFGLPHILSRFGGMTGGLILLATGGLACITAYGLGSRQSGTPTEFLFLAAALGSVFLFPVKAYDLGALAVAFAVIGRMSWPVQLVYFVPMLLVWRPSLLGMFAVAPADMRASVTVIALCMAAAALGFALRAHTTERG